MIDAIESGLVKIPQLAVRDCTGTEIPGYFNIWQWILQPGRLTTTERALPERARLAITFPRVEGYTQAIRNRVTLDWSRVPSLVLEPGRIPPEVDVKGLSATDTGRPNLSGPGRLDAVGLDRFRRSRRKQELAFDVAAALTKQFREQRGCAVPAHALFPQAR